MWDDDDDIFDHDGDDDDSFLSFGPDMDGDGDHDLMDDAILMDLLEDENDEHYDEDDNWREECDDGDEFGINPDDYDSLDEYEEALDEAKYMWRDDCEDGSDYDVDPDDYETLDEYLAALEEAKIAWREDCEDGSEYGLFPEDFDSLEEYEDALSAAKLSGEDSNDDWRDDCEDGSFYDVYPEDYDTLEEYEDALEEARREHTSRHSDGYKTDDRSSAFDATDAFLIASILNEKKEVHTNYSYITQRKNAARSEVRDAEKGDFYGSKEDLARCRFVATDKSTAARYLTVDGTFLYAQAVKDNFDLPFDVPDEKDEAKTSFIDLMKDLALVDEELALKVWHWCLTTFSPYLQYADDKDDLTYTMLLFLDDFKDSFMLKVVEYMTTNRDFIEKLILKCTNSFSNIECLIVHSIESNRVETAKQIIECAFANPILDIKGKISIISSCIDEFSPWQEEELESMETFRDCIFPIVFTETDVRIKCKIPDWQAEIQEYISTVEKNSDKYAYTRINAWREKYRNNEFGIDPTRYENETELLAAIQDKKYGWRKYCYNNRFGINPGDYETRDAFNEALNAAYSAERESKQRERSADPTNTKLYKFCKVATDFPNKPFYYYFVGNLDLKVGDKVIVPFGDSNTETEGIVVALGECYGSAFPCSVNRIKTVLRKFE